MSTEDARSRNYTISFYYSHRLISEASQRLLSQVVALSITPTNSAEISALNKNYQINESCKHRSVVIIIGPNKLNQFGVILNKSRIRNDADYAPGLGVGALLPYRDYIHYSELHALSVW